MAQMFTGSVSLTSDLSTIAYGFRPNYIRVDSATAGTAFISFNTTVVATTASSLGYALTSGAFPLVFDGHGAERNGMSTGFTAVTSSGGTTVIRVLAVRI